jgi:glycosyltransferase involved in cell wall biosynthesis
VVFACSDAIRDSLIKQGVTRPKVISQPTGIDPDRFRFCRKTRRTIRQSYNIRSDDILVGNVGFLRSCKGHDFIIDTISGLDKRYKFMLVGDGYERPFLERQVGELGMGDRVIITGHQENPEDFFSAFDILFFASHESEGIPQSLMQGLLYGLPLLICKTPSLVEPLQHVLRYQLIDYPDLEGARQGLTLLSDSCNQRDEEEVRRQREALITVYGVGKMMDTVLRVYAEYGVRL